MRFCIFSSPPLLGEIFLFFSQLPHGHLQTGPRQNTHWQLESKTMKDSRSKGVELASSTGKIKENTVLSVPNLPVLLLANSSSPSPNLEFS